MDWLHTALENARGGWPQFPVRSDKRPFPGFVDWENKATVSADAIAVWGTVDYPGCLWATTPGRVGVTVIDIDAHPDSPSGYQSLAMFQIPVRTPHLFRSVSGNGEHAWFRGRSTSRNGLYPGIDRKSVGGYVVTPYLLPQVSSVVTRLPEAFHGRDSSEGLYPFHGRVAEWLSERSGFTPAQRVRQVVLGAAREEFRGHQNMLTKQARLVHLGREGHGGVPEALQELHGLWVAASHGRGEDPEREWQTALIRAVRNFGGEWVDGGAGVVGSVGGSGVDVVDRGASAGGGVADAGDGVVGA